MSKQINLDDVFRSGLKPLHEPFDEGAWLNMQNKLTADTLKPKFWVPFLNRKTINILLGAIMLSFVTASMLWFTMKPTLVSAASFNASIVSNNYAVISNAYSKSALVSYAVANDGSYYNNRNGFNSAPSNPNSKTSKNAHTGNSITSNSIHSQSTKENQWRTVVTAINSPQIKPRFKKTKIKNNLRPLIIKSVPNYSIHYNHATLGIHLSYLHPLNSYAAFGSKPGLGFDLEGYSHNLTPGKYYGLFVGGTGSIVWMGRSPKTDITLNTAQNDPGITFLQNIYGDLNFISKVEFGRSRIKFYATGFVGMRGLFVTQEIQSKKPIEGFENSSKTVSTNLMLQWGGGVGMRYHFAPGVSLDIRGMYQDVDFKRVANVRRSEYDEMTGNYQLTYNFIQPQLLCIKVGLLFCIDDIDTHTSSNYYHNPQINIGGMPMPGNSGRSGGGKTPVQIKIPTKTPAKN